MFAGLVFERDPLQLADLPSQARRPGCQDAGGFAAMVLALSRALVYAPALLRHRPRSVCRPGVPTLRLDARRRSAPCWPMRAYFVLRLPELLRTC